MKRRKKPLTPELSEETGLESIELIEVGVFGTLAEIRAVGSSARRLSD